MRTYNDNHYNNMFNYIQKRTNVRHILSIRSILEGIKDNN